MGTHEVPALTAELERKLKAADSQLVLYARDLKRAVDSERARTRELSAANERLRLLDRLKSDFLCFISHELRTPLSMLATLQAYNPDAGAAERTELIEVVKSGYERLEKFITKSLEYFEWVATERVRTDATVALDSVVNEAVNASPCGRLPPEQFQVSIDGDGLFVRGDEQNLSRVVTTLLENAVKFSAEPKWIRVRLAREGALAVLSVTDRGCGFAPELAAEIFRPFTIGDVVHYTEGTGLNLAFAKAIVEAHGGSMRAESRGIGMGAKFIAELPRAPKGSTAGNDGT